MDIASLRVRIELLNQTDPRNFASTILDSGFRCMRCGWCCRENFLIPITRDIMRPSNAISVFPSDIRNIVKGTGIPWNDAAEPDRYSCINDGCTTWAIGWILRRNDSGDCIFYRNSSCTIYPRRPMICRCYPFFLDEQAVDVMRCEGLHHVLSESHAVRLGKLVKRYELKKLRSYIKILQQFGNFLTLAGLHQLPDNYSGTVLVSDGEAITPYTYPTAAVKKNREREIAIKT